MSGQTERTTNSEGAPLVAFARPIMAVVYSESSLAADILRRLAAHFDGLGARCCGFIQHAAPRADRARCDMELEDLSSHETLKLSEDRGEGARGCRLDAVELANAVVRAHDMLATGADILIVNKFGKMEAEGGGFRPVIADALERGIPVLIAIPTCNLDSWRAFAGDLAGEITAETLAGTLRGPHHAVDIERVLAPPA